MRPCFADVPDPRREHLRLHRLGDIIAITICAAVGNADSWVEVVRYGVRKHAWLRTFLELPNGIPSHDTFNRAFALPDPLALRQGFRHWMEALVEATAGRLVAIGGKTLRHSFDSADGKGPLHLVSAWASANRLMLGQYAVDSKSNEITAIPGLVKMLDLSGAIVTIDAMGCQKDIAAGLDGAGADYVSALKANQETLYADVPENLALLRRLAVSLLHQEDSRKVGVACKRKEAGWDNDYLLEVLGASLK